MSLDVRPDYLKIVQDILSAHVPDREVWAFGSRVTGKATETSDLDLAIIGETPLEFETLAALRDAFSESRIPYKVDVVDWATISETFREIIRKDKVVIQKCIMSGIGDKDPHEGGQWRKVMLGNLVEIKHGYAFKGEFIHDKPTGDILLTPGNFNIGGGFNGNKFKYYNGSIPNDYILRENDLIVTMTDLSKESDTLGLPAFIPSSKTGRSFLHNQRLGKIIVRDKQAIVDRYLYYLMCSKEYRHEIVSSATGTTVKHSSPERIKKFHFLLPAIDEQLAIAHILGTLDDKIELNRRMNETLEAMAQAIFKSWFVDFDPVRAKMEGRETGLPKEIEDLFPDSFEDSELGEIPRGWGGGTLGDLIGQRIERISPNPETRNFPYVPIECITSKSIFLRQLLPGSEANSSLSKFYKGDILFGAMRPYFHKVCLAPFDGITRTTAFILFPKEKEDQSFSLYSLFQEETIEFATNHSEGSTIPYAKWTGSLKSKEIVIPPKTLRSMFQKTVSSFIEKGMSQIKETISLSQIKEVLLPKLLSGEIRVHNS